MTVETLIKTHILESFKFQEIVNQILFGWRALFKNEKNTFPTHSLFARAGIYNKLIGGRHGNL